jgi:hypothetical protein
MDESKSTLERGINGQTIALHSIEKLNELFELI